MVSTKNIQYVADAAGNPVAVVIPIDIWREIESERETAYLLQSDRMKQRLMDALQGPGGISMEDVRAQLGI